MAELRYSRGQRRGPDAFIGQNDERARTRREVTYSIRKKTVQAGNENYPDGEYEAARNEVVICNVDDGDFTVNLPMASGNLNEVITVKQASDSSFYLVHVAASPPDLVDGLAVHSLTAAREAVTVISDGTNWWSV